MTARRCLAIALVAVLPLTAGCGGPTPHVTQSGSDASAAAVEVSGRVTQRGTRGSILVFAYSDLAAGEEPTTREAASVGTLTTDGGFDLDVPPSASLSLIFLADGSNDGAVDEGDPIAVLSGPELVDLQGGDRVHLADVRIDFTAHRAAGTIEVVRSGEPQRTPTPVPAP